MSIASIISRVVNTIVRTHMVERLSNNRAFQEFAVKTTETYENLGKKAADGGAKVGEKASKVTESDGFREVADFAKYVCGTPRKASSRSPRARLRRCSSNELRLANLSSPPQRVPGQCEAQLAGHSLGGRQARGRDHAQAVSVGPVRARSRSMRTASGPMSSEPITFDPSRHVDASFNVPRMHFALPFSPLAMADVKAVTGEQAAEVIREYLQSSEVCCVRASKAMKQGRGDARDVCPCAT